MRLSPRRFVSQLSARPDACALSFVANGACAPLSLEARRPARLVCRSPAALERRSSGFRLTLRSLLCCETSSPGRSGTPCLSTACEGHVRVCTVDFCLHSTCRYVCDGEERTRHAAVNRKARSELRIQASRLLSYDFLQSNVPKVERRLSRSAIAIARAARAMHHHAMAFVSSREAGIHNA